MKWPHHDDSISGECNKVQTLSGIANVAQVIQLAVAPVFLLTGVGAILSVLVNRLGRVVDRFRVLEQNLPAVKEVALASVIPR